MKRRCRILLSLIHILNNISLSALLAQLGEDNTDFSKVTQEQQTAFWAAVDNGLTGFAQKLIDQQQAVHDANLEEDQERTVYTCLLYTSRCV